MPARLGAAAAMRPQAGAGGRYMTVFYIYKTRYIVIYFPRQLSAPGVAWVGRHVVPAAFRAVRLVTPSLA